MNLAIPNTATPATPATLAQGERVISPPVLYKDLVIFSTLIPSANPCDSGGESRVMLLDGLTGKRPLTSSFDLFGGTSTTPTITSDGKVDTADLVKIAGKSVAASGISLGIGIHKNISIIGTHGYASGSNGGLGQLNLVGGGSGKRASWQQLK